MQLSVPSSALAQTMTKLSQLAYARGRSRTDNSQDVNNQYVQAKRRLADARALRTSLLKQLANADHRPSRSTASRPRSATPSDRSHPTSRARRR